MALKALLFDVDGTLADTEPQGHLPAYNAAFSEAGLDWQWDTELYRVLLLMPGGRERIRHYLEKYDPARGEHREAVKRDANAWVEDIHKLKSRYFEQLVEEGKVPLRTGVRRLMTEARKQGLRLAIVTNASRRSLDPFLLHTLGKELVEQVDFVVSGEQVEHKKPSPDLYLMALLKLGIDKTECVAIEDSEMGLLAARRAGIATLITVNEDTSEHDFTGAALVVDQLGDPEHPLHILSGYVDHPGWITPSVLSDMLETFLTQDEEE